jgi:hypothetical protein
VSGNVGSVWRRLVLGAAGGVAWGIGMRLWMRFISFDPEFTWSGTLFIVGATTIAGALTGVAYHRAKVGTSNAWRWLALSYLPLGAAAGAVMVPTFVLGGLAWGRRTWPILPRILLAAAAVGFQVFVFTSEPGQFPYGRQTAATAIYAFFLLIETKAFSVMTRPLHRSDVPVPDTPAPLGVGGLG